MFKALFNVLFGVITGIVNVLLTPINLLVKNFIPDLSEMIATWYYVLNEIIGNGFTWFFSILPVHCRTYIIIYLTFLVTYYTVSITAHGILKVYEIIKNVKIW